MINENPFVEYTPVNQEEASTHSTALAAWRLACYDLCEQMNAILPSSAERTLALRFLQMAHAWGSLAIVQPPKHPPVKL